MLMVGILAATAFLRANDFLGEMAVEHEAAKLAADLRSLASQSRTNAYRAGELEDFYAPDSLREMKLDATGYRVYSPGKADAYRYDFPVNISLTVLRSAPGAVINFGHNGGTVQNNTFRLALKNNPAVCRYVVVNPAGRVRISKTPPGE